MRHADPHARSAKAVRIRKLAHRATTGMTATAFAGMGIANLLHAAPIMNGLAKLGYPPYFATIIGAWKLLAAIALFTPVPVRAKEWAYAGICFTLTGAALSHILNHDAAVTIVAPLVLLGVAMTSPCLRWQNESLRRRSVSEPTGVENNVEH